MLKSIFLSFTICLLSISATFSSSDSISTYMQYEIDLTNTEDDLFQIILFPGKLNPENEYFNFVAFAPGVHQVLNYGRFVKTFIAYDENDTVIKTEKISEPSLFYGRVFMPPIFNSQGG